jgi:hypothetical protein
MKDIEGMHIMTRRRLLNFAQNSPKLPMHRINGTG